LHVSTVDENTNGLVRKMLRAHRLCMLVKLDHDAGNVPCSDVKLNILEATAT
jgi:hypothetical protein